MGDTTGVKKGQKKTKARDLVPGQLGYRILKENVTKPLAGIFAPKKKKE